MVISATANPDAKISAINQSAIDFITDGIVNEKSLLIEMIKHLLLAAIPNVWSDLVAPENPTAYSIFFPVKESSTVAHFLCIPNIRNYIL